MEEQTYNESEDFVREKLDFIVQHAVEKETYYCHLVRYGRKMESHWDAPAEIRGLVRDVQSPEAILLSLMDEVEGGIPQKSMQLWRKDAAKLKGDSSIWNHGFNCGCLAMARLYKYLAGPCAGAPLTAQRAMRAILRFPECAVPGTEPFRAAEREDAAKARYSRAFPTSFAARSVSSSDDGRKEKKRQKHEPLQMDISAFNNDMMMRVASFANPRDMLSLALTCRRFGSKDVREQNWSMMEEVARLVIEESASKEYKLCLPGDDERGSWMGAYQEFVHLRGLGERPNFLKEKLELFRIVAAGRSFEDFTYHIVREGRFRLLCNDEDDSIWFNGFNNGCLGMSRLFGSLARIQDPSQNPTGLSEQELEMRQDGFNGGWIWPVQDQRNSALWEFPFLDT